MEQQEKKWDAFISYAREDDEPFVKKLYEDLESQGLRVWWDREAMENRGRTFLQEIRDAIASVDRVILVIGPKALESKYVRVEWDFALAVCRAVVPVLRLGDYSDVPEELQESFKVHSPDFREERDYQDALNELLRLMASSIPPLANLYGVDALPPNFLQREDVIEQLKKDVLGDTLEPIVITSTKKITALKGMGGIGKSVLAAAFAQGCYGRKAFGDGIIWIRLGENADLISQMRGVGQALGDDDPQHYIDEMTCKNSLSKLLANSTCLLVLDDIWNIKDAEAFVNVLGPRCRALITTRDAEIAEGLGAQVYSLDVLSDEQALTLLARWSEQDEKKLPPEAREIIDECGNLPLAVAMIGAMIKGRPNRWSNVLERLRRADLDRIKRQFPNYAYPNLMRAIQVSVDALEPDFQDRYLDLAVFPKDTLIPEAVLKTFWQPEGLDELDTQDAMDEFVDRSLARCDHIGFINLHDLQVDYVRKQADDLAVLHNRLLEAYKAKCTDGWHTGPDDRYFFQHLPYHLAEAGRLEELEKLLMDFRWLEAKLAVTDANALINDYDLMFADLSLSEEFSGETSEIEADHKIPPAALFSKVMRVRSLIISWLKAHKHWFVGTKKSVPLNPPFLRGKTEDLKLAQRSIRLAAHILDQDKEQLVTQLTGRLVSHKSAGIKEMLEEICQYKTTPWLCPTAPSFAQAGDALLRTLTGHTYWISSVAVTPDSRYIISGSRDETLKVWDMNTWKEVKTLEGHTGRVNAVTVTSDSRYAISGSIDNTLKVWDLETWREVKTLKGHADSVTDVAVTSDSRYAISGSADKTLKVWNLKTWREVKTLEGHTEYVFAVTVTPDSRYAISGSEDRMLKVWNLETWKEVKTLEGHTDDIYAVTVTPDSRYAISGSRDTTLKVWDLETWQEVETIEGDTEYVFAVTVTPDGRYAISGSDDKTLKVWDLETYEEVKTLEGHDGDVMCVAVTPDSRCAISGSEDEELKIWDLETWEEARILKKHAGQINAIAITPDGNYAISGSDDRTLKVWHLETWEEVRTLKGHTREISSVTVTPDGRYIISGSFHNMLKVWDMETGEEVKTLEGHTSRVSCVTVTPDGRYVISGALSAMMSYDKPSDNKLKVWDLETWEEVKALEGETGAIMSITVTPDSCYVISAVCFPSGSFGKPDDYKLRVWDLETWEEVKTIEGYGPVAVTPDSRYTIARSKHNTLKVWNLETWEEVKTIEGHGTLTVAPVAVTPDNLYIISGSGSKDGTLEVWDLKTWEIVASFTGERPIHACAVSQDGKTIIVGDDSGQVHFLRLEGV